MSEHIQKREQWAYWPRGDKDPINRLYRFDIERCVTMTRTFWRYIGQERELSEAEVSDMIKNARARIAAFRKSNYSP